MIVVYDTSRSQNQGLAGNSSTVAADSSSTKLKGSNQPSSNPSRFGQVRIISGKIPLVFAARALVFSIFFAVNVVPEANPGAWGSNIQYLRHQRTNNIFIFPALVQSFSPLYHVQILWSLIFKSSSSSSPSSSSSS